MPHENEWQDKRRFAEKYRQVQSQVKQRIIFPDLLDRLAKQKPERLLDYGCGAGLFLRDFTKQLNIEQIGYDPAESMYALAKENCSSVPGTTITNSIGNYQPGYFDAITKTAVWMLWQTDDECMENLRTIKRLLRADGRFYVVVTHPCFRDRKFANHALSLDMEKYFVGGCPFQTGLKDRETALGFVNYHWPITAMWSQLKRADFEIEDFFEYPDIVPSSKGSPWLLLLARPI